MKKWIFITAAVMFAVGLALGGAYVALAQTPPPLAHPFGGPGMMRGWGVGQPFTGTAPFGPGMMRGWGAGGPFTGTVPFGPGMMNGPLYDAMMGPGGVHEQVWTAVAKQLDLTYSQLQSELQTKTLAQLAQEKGVKLETLQATAQTTQKAALDQFVKDGKLTREQADWLTQHLDTIGLGQVGGGFGPCPGGVFGGPPGPGFQNGRGRGMMGRTW